MTHEMDVYGVFIPDLFVWMIGAQILASGISRVLLHFDLYRFVWHRPLFNLSLYVILLGFVVFAGRQLLT